MRTSIVVACVLAACGPAKYYAYQQTVDLRFTDTDSPEPASATARQLLRDAKIIAFAPPDRCNHADHVSGSASIIERDLLTECGVVLSLLERSAERAGYEVFSWQNLRSEGRSRPLDLAREAHVDILFELNDLGVSSLDDSQVKKTTTFYQGSEPSALEPFAVDADIVAPRCEAYARDRSKPQLVAITGTLDVKMVSVKDGINRWHYRKTVSHDWAKALPMVTFAAKKQSSAGGKFLLGLGVITGVIGFGTAASTCGDCDDIGNKLLVGGLIGTVAGIVTIVRKDAVEPERVMCQGEPYLADAQASRRLVTSSSRKVTSSTRVETHGDPTDTEAKDNTRTAILGEFLQVLREAQTLPRSSRPEQPTTASEPTPSSSP